MPESPLNANHRKLIDGSLYKLANLRAKLDMAEQAGFPVDEVRSDLEHMYEWFMKMKKVYFPGGQ